MRSRSAMVVRIAAFVAVIATIVGVAIVAQGFDVKQAPVASDSIWVINKSGAAGSGQYGRVNTGLHEFDTVKDADSPASVVQNGISALLVTSSNANIGQIDASKPQEFPAESTDLKRTPSDTKDIVSTGDYIGYRSSSGRISVATLQGGTSVNPTQVNPYANEPVAEGAEPKSYVSDAITIGVDGILYSYSSALKSVLSYNIARGTFDQVAAAGPATADDIAGFTAVGSTWVLFDKNHTMWTKKLSGVPTITDAAITMTVQDPSIDDGYVYFATPSSLGRVAISSGSVEPNLVQGVAGSPAVPSSRGAVRYAAWLQAGATTGTLWSSDGGTKPLAYGGKDLGAQPSPVLRSNGTDEILNETGTGLVWTAPDGELVPSSIDWTLTGKNASAADPRAEQVSPPTTPEPPTARADAFGVRAGQLVPLPVLLNDSDPNSGDVMTIDPASVTGLPASFGTLSLTNNSQQLAVLVKADGPHSATFSYAVTDGTAVNGLKSAPATVTLTVHAPNVNAAPKQCDSDCTQPPPSLQVQAGNSARTNVLASWFDPDGDPFYVSAAALVEPSAVSSVAALPDGTLVFQNSDPKSAGATAASVAVKVSDSLGATAPLVVPVTVTAQPRMTVESFAATTRTGEQITIDPSSHVIGAAGQYAVTAVAPPDNSGVIAEITSDRKAFQFTAKSAGTFVVSFKVTDAAITTGAQVRVTVLDDSASSLTTAPITVYVRPKLDTTVDVFSAVSNPGGKVLLLTSATPDASNASSKNPLDFAVVDHQLLRVKGATLSGSPGLIGVIDYTVADGGGTSTVTGRATVIYLDPGIETPPIAVDDTVIVRAGAQVDVPVLDNDVAADGNTVVLASEGLEYPQGKGLAFVSGSKVRILAPTQQDSYTISYSIYSAGDPSSRDSALIHVEVREPVGNQNPLPRTLEGRVYAGEKVSIPFDGTGLDPDGDSVTLDRIESQPQAVDKAIGAGIASISSRGDAIEYVAPLKFVGVAQFSYRVKDSAGGTAVALVRIGVLGNASDPNPVTYSDYVEVEVDGDPDSSDPTAKHTVQVFPTANDLDPRGNPLTLVSVVPDELQYNPDGVTPNPEYAALAALIGPTKDGGVMLSAGTVPGTKTFRYVVKNSTGTGSNDGYIVLKVVRRSVPDLPRVTDTYLSIDDRANFGNGIDVVTGKVSWLSGDVAHLTLSLWDSSSGFTVEGRTIKGTLPARTVKVPFQLAGKNNSGADVVTYGFLTVPGIDDIILALKAGAASVSVTENKSVVVPVTDLVSAPADDQLVISAAVATGQRPNGSCVLAGGTVTYTAGQDAPWDDACIVTLRLTSQSADRLTQLVIPIAVIPDKAVPVLTSGTSVVVPDATGTFDLTTLVDRWNGVPTDDERRRIAFAIKSDDDPFTVSYDAATRVATFHADDGAVPGRKQIVEVSLVGEYAGQSTTLTLTVGSAPQTLPTGAKVLLECNTADGTSCSTQVIGKPGEVNLYPSTPLLLTHVDPTSTCAGVNFKAAGQSIVASFSTEVAGSTCNVGFVVEDVQGHSSSGDRNGVLSLDLHGFPAPATSVRQIGYGDNYIDLKVEPSKSRSYPDIDHYEIQLNGHTVTNCKVNGDCDPITSGLTNGKHQIYTAISVNTEPENSRSGPSTEAWSYAEPRVGNVKVVSAYDPVSTTVDKGVVDVSVTGFDPSVDHFEFTGVSGSVSPAEATAGKRIVLPVSISTDITVTPFSKFDVPSGTSTSTSAATAKTTKIAIVGAPRFGASIALTPKPTSLGVTDPKLDLNFSKKNKEQLFIAYSSGSVTCTVGSGGNGLSSSGWSGGNSVANSGGTATIAGLTPNQQYSVVACGSNGYGVVQSDPVTESTFQPPAAPVGFTYTIGTSPTDGEYRVSGVNEPAIPPLDSVGFQPVYNITDLGSIDKWGESTGLTVKYCSTAHPERCGASSNVPAAPSSAPFQVRVTGVTDPTCTVGSPLGNPDVTSSVSNRTVALTAGWTYTDSADADVARPAAPDEANVPAGATHLHYSVTVTWTGDYSGLDNYVSGAQTANCS